jgi:hypothetical protein
MPAISSRTATPSQLGTFYKNNMLAVEYLIPPSVDLLATAASSAARWQGFSGRNTASRSRWCAAQAEATTADQILFQHHGTHPYTKG